jgi:predicted aldo/keto reductase-like oxidoreductase
MKRRSFLKVVGGVTGGLALGSDPFLHAAHVAPVAEAERVSGMPRRVLGRTGQKVSIVGYPGLALIHHEQARCTESLHRAFDQGVNYFDNAPAYGNGDAEIKMGEGLVGLDRDKLFLACKTNKRDKEGAREELERSLKRFKTDHFELYQLHHLRTPEEVKQALGPNGAMETLLKAKEEGKIKYIGFSAHTTKGAIQAMEGFQFDTVMFPINFVELFLLGFGQEVLDLAERQGTAVVAIKPMCRGAWPEGVERTRKWWYRPVEDLGEIDLALRFTLSQKMVVAGFPPAFVDLTDRAIEVGRNYRPTTPAEVGTLRQLAQSCESIFRREEEQVAHAMPCRGGLFPGSPYEHA